MGVREGLAEVEQLLRLLADGGEIGERRAAPIHELHFLVEGVEHMEIMIVGDRDFFEQRFFRRRLEDAFLLVEPDVEFEGGMESFVPDGGIVVGAVAEHVAVEFAQGRLEMGGDAGAFGLDIAQSRLEFRDLPLGTQGDQHNQRAHQTHRHPERQ